MMEHPGVQIFGQADYIRYELDFEVLAARAEKGGVIFEINEASLTLRNYQDI